MIELNGPLVLAGAGKMGGALVAGLVARGIAAERVVVQDPAPPPDVAALLARHGIRAEPLITTLAVAPAVIVLAVKPQLVEAVAPGLGALAGPETVVLSIAAGRTLASLEKHFPPGTAVVRAMPNTPAAIGAGITVCVANASTSSTQRATCTALLGAVGEVAWVEDEPLMDAVTAVSGSGPAYVFLLAEALAEAGCAAGLDMALARRLAAATVSGAGALMKKSGEDPAALRKNVTSPGGTTAAALAVLMAENGGLRELLARAVAAAADRGRELAK